MGQKSNNLTEVLKGIGLIDTLPVELTAKCFLKYVKTKLTLQHTNYLRQSVRKGAINVGQYIWLLEDVLNKFL